MEEVTGCGASGCSLEEKMASNKSKLESKIDKFASKVDRFIRWLETTKFVKSSSKFMLRTLYSGCSDEVLLGYNHALKSELEKAYTLFEKNSYQPGMLMVADKYLEAAEKKFRDAHGKGDANKAFVDKITAKPLAIYAELGGSDPNILRIADMYRKIDCDEEYERIDKMQWDADKNNWYSSPNKDAPKKALKPEERHALIEENIRLSMK